MEPTRNYNLWVLIERAPDLDGAWLAHCVDIDIVSWGDSPASARQAIEEALLLAIEDDLAAGLDPLDRPSAPEEIRERLETLRRVGRPVDISRPDVAEREKVSRFASLVSLQVPVNGRREVARDATFAQDAA